jgi:hypothetical protein
VMVLDGIETEKPSGAENDTVKLDDPQPASLLNTSIAYVSTWPGVPHDPGAAHAQVLSIEARGAPGVHVDVVPPPPAFAASALVVPSDARIAAVARTMTDRYFRTIFSPPK